MAPDAVARAVGKKHRRMAALHIDAHTDSYPYGADEKYNSATQFTHVAEEGLVDPEFSWHVGIRSTTYAQGVVPRAMPPTPLSPPVTSTSTVS